MGKDVNRVIEEFLFLEEPILEVKEPVDSDSFKDLDPRVPNINVILLGKNRKRTVNLKVLNFIYHLCTKDFVKDYLDLSLSLREIMKKYNCYTEIQFASRCVKKYLGMDGMREELILYLGKDLLETLKG